MSQAGAFFYIKKMRKSRKYSAIARRILRERAEEFADILDSEVRIAYLESDQEKRRGRKTIYGECHRVDADYSWCCPYDFFIVVYEPNVEEFSPAQLEILIRHELHHIGVSYTDTGIKYFIVPHDVEEFRQIIDECGLDWSDRDAERRAPK